MMMATASITVRPAMPSRCGGFPGPRAPAPGAAAVAFGRRPGALERSLACQATVLVTGGAGFVGSHVAEALLAQGTDVVLVDDLTDNAVDVFPSGTYGGDRKLANVELVRAAAQCEGAGGLHVAMESFADRSAMAELFAAHPIDAVCHMGARAGVRPSLECPEDYVHVNITGTTILLDLAAKAKCTNFVYASSSSVYGERAPGGKGDMVPFLETDDASAQISPYATTKRATELMATTYSMLHGLPTTGLRFFTVYGPRGRPDMALLKFVQLALDGKPVQQYGDGSSWRDYTYISDVVDGVIGALRHPLPPGPNPSTVLNLGCGTPVRLHEFISSLQEVMGEEMVVEVVGDRAGDVGGTYADISRARELVGYSPKVPLREGLQRTVDWFRASQWGVK